MNASAFRDLWARVMFLKLSKIARAVGKCNLKSFQNIMSDHKSQKMHDVLFVISSKLRNALGAHSLKHFSMVSKMLACFL